MESSAALDFRNAWSMEKDRMIAKHKSDLALQEELLEKEEQELSSINDRNLQKLKATVPSALYRDTVLPMAEKSLKHDLREVEVSHSKRVRIIKDKHMEELARHQVLYHEKLKVGDPADERRPAAKSGALPSLSESTDAQSGRASLPRDVSASLGGLEEYRRLSGKPFASQNPKQLFELCKPLSCAVQHEIVCGEPRLIMRVQSRKRKAPVSKETSPKRLRVDTSVNQVRTPAPTPSSEPARPSGRTITFDEVYQGGNAKHKDIILEWPAGSQKWYILKCELHGLRFTKNSVQGAAKHLNGMGHGFTNRNRNHAVEALGYLVTDCSKALAKLNNQVAEEAYANGYKPPPPGPNKRRGVPKDPKKHVGAPGLARPSVPYAASLAPKSTLEMSSTSEKATAKGPQELSTASAYQKSPDSRDGITHPKTFHIYYGRWKDNDPRIDGGQIYPVMILGWDSQNGSGLKDSDLNATGLLKQKAQPPNCYTYDSKKITGWAPGYEDGGSKVRSRKFPVMFFDKLQTVSWFPARDLMEFPLYQSKVPDQPDHPFNAARRWIAEREGFKTWEDREKARISAHPQPALPLTPAESANAASHIGECVELSAATKSNSAADSRGLDGLGRESEAMSTDTTVTEELMREGKERGGEITDDEDYVASGSDFDDTLDCEIDDWIRSSPSMANSDNATDRPWAFYGLRSTEKSKMPKPSVESAREAQGSPTKSAAEGIDSARRLARDACLSATDSRDVYMTPTSDITQPLECSPQVTQDPGQSDKSRSDNRLPSHREPIRENNLAEIIAKTLKFQSDVHDATTTSEKDRFTSQTLEHRSPSAVPVPIENDRVQPPSGNEAITTPQGQAGKKTYPTPTARINTEVPATSSSTDLTGSGLVHNGSRDIDNVGDSSFSNPTTPHSIKSTIHVRASGPRAESQAVENKEVLVEKKLTTTRVNEMDVKNLIPVSGPVSVAEVPELPSADADFELSFYRNGDVSWERSNKQEDCVRLFHSADRRTMLTRQGPVNIAVDPMELAGFSREKDIIPDSKGNTAFILRHKDGSSSRLVFDRSKGSKLGNGKLQVRGFIKWLRTVKRDIPCFRMDGGANIEGLS
ncbi:hypothetical protein F4781DRAFT_435000 [Annulohypoxylon bovei var. microspora]|nr:hypothetical protein F4781DRAFT_435000 [Annulohypoxylon bovei var. microspora]